jgi:hypothetical protein
VPDAPANPPRAGEDAGVDQRRLIGECREHGPGVRAERLEGVDEPVARLAGRAGQSREPRADVHRVIPLLALELADEPRQRVPRTQGERLEPHRVRGLVQVPARDRHRPVAAAVVKQPGVAILRGLAVVGDRVRVGAVEFGEQPVQRRRVPQLVLGQRAHRHILFEQRRDPGPFRVRETDDELVVGHREQQVVEPEGRWRSRAGHKAGSAGARPSHGGTAGGCETGSCIGTTSTGIATSKRGRAAETTIDVDSGLRRR